MTIMSLFTFLILLGLATWLITAFLPLDPGIKRVIQVVAIVVAVLVCLQAFGILGGLNMRVPSVR